MNRAIFLVRWDLRGAGLDMFVEVTDAHMDLYRRHVVTEKVTGRGLGRKVLGPLNEVSSMMAPLLLRRRLNHERLFGPFHIYMEDGEFTDEELDQLIAAKEKGGKQKFIAWLKSLSFAQVNLD